MSAAMFCLGVLVGAVAMVGLVALCQAANDRPDGLDDF